MVGSLLCKHQDLSLDSQHLCRKLGVVVNICTISQVLARWRQEDPGGLLTGQSSRIGKLQIPVLEINRWGMLEKDIQN